MLNPNPPPDQTIQAVHNLGANLGFRRVRVDRSERDRVWFEVGYGCREILIRTSSGARYRANANQVSLDQVATLLLALLEEGELAVSVQSSQREDEVSNDHTIGLSGVSD